MENIENITNRIRLRVSSLQHWCPRMGRIYCWHTKGREYLDRDEEITGVKKVELFIREKSEKWTGGLNRAELYGLPKK
jgi:hypothetical protein